MDRNRKREIRAALRREEAEALESSLPLGKQELRALFSHLDVSLEAGCDHTARITLAWLQARGLDAGRIMPWLQSLGGYCDCEILANVEERLGDILDV